MAMTRSYNKLIDSEVSTRTLELADPPFCMEGLFYAGKQNPLPQVVRYLNAKKFTSMVDNEQH